MTSAGKRLTASNYGRPYTCLLQVQSKSLYVQGSLFRLSVYAGTGTANSVCDVGWLVE